MNKELAIKLLRGSVLETNEQLHEAVFMAIKALKDEPKHGEWIPGKEIAREFLAGNVIYVDYLNYRCSVCGATVGERETMMYHFCPNCGADMRGGEND